jgi:hypothetical protein
VSEVYQILEFYHIIDDYISINEALKSFGKSTKSDKPGEESKNGDDISDEPIDKLLALSGVEPHMGENPKQSDVVVVQEQQTKVPNNVQSEVAKKPVRVFKSPKIKRRTPQKKKQDLNFARLPLNEKIKYIISDTPLITLLKIQKELRQEKYGSSQISLFKLYRILKTLNLNTKEKRYRYYRSV